MNRLNQERGMKWYKFLLVIIPFGIISDAVSPLMDVSNVASNNGVQFGDVVSALPGYVIPHILSGFIIALTLAVLEYHLYKRSSLCAPLVRLYLAVCTFLFIILAILEQSYAGSVDVTFFSNLFSSYVIWVPTYFYLKKRFSEPEYQTKPAEPIPHADIEPVSEPQPEQQTAPQTEWNAYIKAYSEELDTLKAKPAETECASKPASAPELESDVQMNEHCSEDFVTEPETPNKPEATRPKFCRKCGKPLRADSDFCEWCGESVK